MSSSNDTEKSERLIADDLVEDKRIAEAKRLVLEAVKEHQQKLKGIRPPASSLTVDYEQMLNAFAEYRGAKLWYPYLGSGLGNGCFVELADGSVKYDFICGIGSHYFGHNHPNMISAAFDSAISNTLMQGHLQQNRDVFELTRLLVKAVKMDHCFLTTSGAMANENALKIAFQKRFPANRILAFEKCFMGRTLALSQITDKPAFRDGLPSTVFVDYLPFFDPAAPEESTQRAVAALRKYIARYPKQHAVFCCELVQGEAGFHIGSKDFFHALMTIAKENQIAIFVDEVQTFARTPELMAFHYFELESFVDIATIGKLSLICATFFTDEYKPKPGLLSQTFIGSSSAIKAAGMIVKQLLSGEFFGPEGKITKLHKYFSEHLENLTKKYPALIQGPYGIGCMIAFTPYGGENEKVTDFVHRLFKAGVISFIAGSNPTRVRFLIPAGAVTFEDIDNVIKIVEQVLNEV